MEKPTFLTPDEKRDAYVTLKFWGGLFLGFAVFDVIIGHCSPVEALWRRGFWPLFGLWTLLWRLAVPRVIFVGRCQKLLSSFSGKISALVPAEMEAWSARSVVTLIAVCGLGTLIFTSSSGWAGMAAGLVASAVGGMILWVLMSWTDGLQARSKTQGQRVLGAFKLLLVLGAAWLGFIFLCLWLTGKYA